MKSSVASITWGLAFLTAASVQSAPAANLPTGPALKHKIAFSHDGNSYDQDDWGAVAFTPAIAWAFGKSKDVVHFDHSNNMNLNQKEHYENMKASVAGTIKYFGINKDIVFDDQIPTEATAAVANFVAVSKTLSADNLLFYMCAGPMEIPWRCLNATPLEKRPFIHLVSHSTWNEDFKDKSKTWANMKSLPGGAIYHDLPDQNGNFGKKSNWDKLLNYNEVLTWLESRATLPNGATNDVSDCGMTWWAMTGAEDGKPDQLVAKLKAAFVPTSLQQNGTKTVMNFINRPGKVDVRIPASGKYSRILVADSQGKTLQFSIGQEKVEWTTFETSQLKNGLYFISLKAADGSLRSLGKLNIVK